ncbi:hypothetical protein NG796_11690 [Laspinema sp. A4]|uniref:hypothetical protein n=1 Tax=Laspinema sp. D2d TaxID=2953686 RepID=UPI0021BAF745|nr:hypothetical protein [Laspinema sp. D2d]MCT7983960.1 hypothetical protein [Laspinema sp. D2d]
MVIRLYINCSSGPLPLLRGGLGWGSLLPIATSRTQKRRSRLYGGGSNLFLRDVRSHITENPTLTLPLARGGDRR